MPADKESRKKYNWKNSKEIFQGWNGNEDGCHWLCYNITEFERQKTNAILIFMSGLTSAKNISHMVTKSFSFYQLKVESMLLKKIIYMFGPETHLCSLRYQTRYLLLSKLSMMPPQGGEVAYLFQQHLSKWA